MTEFPKHIGWRRLLLNNSQKFILDVSRIGQKKDKVETFIIFMEGVFAGHFLYDLKRFTRRTVMKTYWALAPKRLQVSHWGTHIHEHLPWFNNSRLCKTHDGIVYAYTGGDKEYVYSWKKAYKISIENQRLRKQEEAQRKINRSLQRLKESDPFEPTVY